MPSLSDRVPDALRVGGGASIAAIFFLFFEAKKLPKNPPFVLELLKQALVYQSWGQLGLVSLTGVGH
jgi:hypothetical protein